MDHEWWETRLRPATQCDSLAGLKAWALAIAQRRGKRIATVALARPVAGILYAMWRDDAPYQALPLRAVAA